MSDDHKAEPLDEDRIDRACAWSDYRSAYGIRTEAMTAAHLAFCAGWDAARGADLKGVLS